MKKNELKKIIFEEIDSYNKLRKFRKLIPDFNEFLDFVDTHITDNNIKIELKNSIHIFLEVVDRINSELSRTHNEENELMEIIKEEIKEYLSDTSDTKLTSLVSNYSEYKKGMDEIERAFNEWSKSPDVTHEMIREAKRQLIKDIASEIRWW